MSKLSVAASPDGEDLRCSAISRNLGERAAGSAGGSDRFLLVELPLPWPKKIDSHPLLGGVPGGPQTRGATTILGVASAADGGRGGLHRVVSLQRRQGFAGFDRVEALVPLNALTATVSTLVTDGPEGLAASNLVDPTAGTEDFLVCTHGSRDRCCGQFGMQLFDELAGALPDRVQLWRSSHTGGHRFAPTGIHFPTGTTWAYLTAQVVGAIVNQSESPESLATHYRGNAAVIGRAEQIADGLGFSQNGWDWLETERGLETWEGEAGSRFASVTWPGGRLEFTVQEQQPLPVPVCGEGTQNSTKESPQLRLIQREND